MNAHVEAYRATLKVPFFARVTKGTATVAIKATADVYAVVTDIYSSAPTTFSARLAATRHALRN